MGEAPKLVFIAVVDEGDAKGEDGRKGVSFRYTRSMLQSTLQLMGCKARHAFKISRRVFEVIRNEFSADDLAPYGAELSISDAWDSNESGSLGEGKVTCHSAQAKVKTSSLIPFESYKRKTTAFVTREKFLNVICGVLSEYKYVGSNQRADLILACRIRERKQSITILLCGTSGCGKSTLSALLGSRLGITTVISTDSIRHMMRSFVDERQNPLLWASTYHAGEFLDPVAVGEAKAKRKAKKLSSTYRSVSKEEVSDCASNEGQSPCIGLGADFISKKQMAIEGFKAQSEMVIDSLDRLITAWEDRRESVIVEGVHLSLNFVMGLMKKHPLIIPFMIYIANEEKHMERFAVRAKYMTLDPAKNKYIKYIRNIRTIQEYLCNRADKHLVPKINNTNVDRSVAAIHATVFSCLRRREAGEQLYDSAMNTVPIIDAEYRNQCAANSMSSKGMFQLIQRKGSSRHLMALLNKDGTVAKAWPVTSGNDSRKLMSEDGGEKCFEGPIYGPLQIEKAEPVNLHFGNSGVSAWPSDTGGTNHSGSVDDSRADGNETCSRYFSSCCSSPKKSEGPAKELKEESSVSGSEEADNPAGVESDEDLSDADKKIPDEMEGSVDEDSTKSDEEFEDLAMRDGLDNGYWSEDDEPNSGNKQTVAKDLSENCSELFAGDDRTEDLDIFLQISQRVSEPSFSYSLPSARNLRNKRVGMMKRSLSDSSRFHSHPQNIQPLGKSGSLCAQPIPSGAL